MNAYKSPIHLISFQLNFVCNCLEQSEAQIAQVAMSNRSWNKIVMKLLRFGLHNILFFCRMWKWAFFLPLKILHRKRSKTPLTHKTCLQLKERQMALSCRHNRFSVTCSLIETTSWWRAGGDRISYDKLYDTRATSTFNTQRVQQETMQKYEGFDALMTPA